MTLIAKYNAAYFLLRAFEASVDWVLSDGEDGGGAGECFDTSLGVSNGLELGAAMAGVLGVESGAELELRIGSLDGRGSICSGRKC